MAGCRCSACDVSFPTKYTLCPICNGDTWKFDKGDYDADWEAQVYRLQRVRQYESGGYLHNADLKVISWRGQLFIAEESLLKEGYPVGEGVIVRVDDDHFYELMGRRKGEIPAWWVQKVEWQDHFMELPELGAHEYSQLELRRVRG